MSRRINSFELSASQKPSALNGNLYKNLRDEVKSLTEDLIDLGQDDGKNILEVFDPLFETKEEMQQRVPAQSTSFRVPPPYGLYPPPISEAPESEDNNFSINLSNYGWKSEVSLYPNLPPPTTSIVGSEGDHQAILYDAYNQFEYLYAVSSESSSFYWHPNEASPYSNDVPPSPSRPSSEYVPAQTVRLAKLKRSSSENIKRRGKLYEDITILKKVAQNDGELIAFVDMLQSLKLSVRMARSKDPYSCTKSATVPSECWSDGLSLKILVYNENFTADPVTFTSEVSTPVQIIIEETISRMEIGGTGVDYIFRVKCFDEYFDSDRKLIEYRYVQECIKFDEDINLVLVHKSSLAKGTWTRPRVDSAVENVIQPEEIMPTCDSKVITFAEIAKFLEVIDRESDKMNEKVSDGTNSINPTPLMQTVKGICVLLGDMQTIEIRSSLQVFCKTCENWNSEAQKFVQGQTPQSIRRTVIGSDLSARHSYVEIIKKEKSPLEVQKDCVLRTKETVIDSVRMLVEMYSKSFPVSFQMNCSMDSALPGSCNGSKAMSEMLEPFLVRVSALHRIKSDWCSSYVDYFVAVEVFHGTRLMGKQTSPNATLTKINEHLFFNSVIIDSWVDFQHLPICILPRECRLVFSVYGRKLAESGDSHETIELGWASMQFFNYQGFLIRGNQLLPLWPVGMPQKRLGPAPNSAFSYDLNVPLITIEFPDFGRDLQFPDIPNYVPIPRDFLSLDISTQLQLKDIIETATFTKFPAEDREVLWEKRHYLYTFPTALPKVLLSAQFWDFASLSELHKILEIWAPLSPPEALQLLLPCFPDAKVRQTAIRWISKMSVEDLITVLPQLVEALSYETFDLSPLSEFLLKQSLFHFEIAHSLFWNLVSEIGLGKWGSELEFGTIQFTNPCRTDDQTDPRRRRLELMRNSLMTIAYHKWKNALISEFKLMQGLCDVTTLVKLAPPSQRSSVLGQELKRMDIQLFGGHTVYTLPLSPSYIVTSLDVETCICYNSASVPLKINFKSALPEGGVIPVLFKQGDDIRQDMLTIQVIRMIEAWWLKDGLDLRVVTFSCVPTGFKQGVVEIVSDAETLCKIQAEYGVTGAFKKNPISEWLAKMNSSTYHYRRAVENFTRSCAAYCVITYVLGICDRHNDNIMLTTKGHLFHIDFGKFLGDSQMFGSFKRDRAPFVLTTDMLYVINDGEKVSENFQHFVELCCKAFRIVRQNGGILMNLFAMMATAGIPGVDIKSVAYIQNALLPDCSNVEAAAKFTRFIEDSLTNWFTPVNFFIHSLAQLRFASETTDNPSTLSFMPKMYNMDGEGRIESATLMGFQKDYDPEKYYLFSVKVKRKDLNEPAFVHRSYKQFLELYSKLCINFPMAACFLKPLPKKSGIGRSNVKQVAEKRSVLLHAFLESLFTMADEISHSDLVYTFFHPTLKDEEYYSQDEKANKKANRRLLSPDKIHGRIDVCILYSKGTLKVLIKHANDLACPNGQPPSAYVKSYLQPDALRLTKRKTRIVKRSQRPTFMEMIEYRLPLNVVIKRILQLSVWHQETLPENTFLGGVSIPLNSIVLENETTQTFILGNLTITH